MVQLHYSVIIWWWGNKCHSPFVRSEAGFVMRKDQYLPQYLSECPPKISKPISAIVFGFCGCPWINSLQKGTRHKTRPEDHCRDDAIHLLRIFCTKSEKYVKTISEKYIMMISEKYIKTMSEKYIKTIS